MSSWRTVSENPVDPRVHRHLWQQTRSLCQPIRGRFDDFLHAAVDGQEVLDIGCAEHDQSHWDRPDWQHAKLVAWSKRTIGVDILPSAVAALCERGYDVRCLDATSDADLGIRVDRVVLGDVLEHVSDPVALLRFSARHLKPDGRILARTPNPFWWRYWSRAVTDGIMIENGEHVGWITPCNALELAERAGLELTSYHPITSAKAAWNPIHAMLRVWSGREPEVFSHSSVYVFSHGGGLRHA